MDLGVWIGIVGVVATVAFGLPALFMARRGGQDGEADRISIEQVANVRIRDSHDVHNHFVRGESENDEWEEVIGVLAIAFFASAPYWSLRLYIVVLLASFVIGAVVLLWAGHRYMRAPGAGVPITMAIALLAVTLILLAFPGLPWGAGWQLRWTYRVAMHRYGIAFVVEPLVVLFVTILGVAILLARGLAPLVGYWRIRSRRVTAMRLWAWAETNLSSIGWRSGTPWIAVALGTVAVAISIAFPHVGTSHATHTYTTAVG